MSPVKGGGVGWGDFSVISKTGWDGAIPDFSVSCKVKVVWRRRLECHQYRGLGLEMG